MRSFTLQVPLATLATLTTLAALSTAACGPAPYMLPGDEVPAVAVAEAQPGSAEAPDRWIPEVFPRPNPFLGPRTWVGGYDCPQGRTDLTLHITDARGTWVRAVFDFRHAASGAAGKYYVAGLFDEGSGRIVLAPGPWIEQPDDYIAVGMDGQVSRDKVFTGKITHPDCGAFRLRPAR